METSIVDYDAKSISFLKLPGNDLLLKTTDICNVLGIVDRPANSALGQPCLDLASAVNLALADDENFAMWLNETFAGYNLETLVHPTCDDDWNFDTTPIPSELPRLLVDLIVNEDQVAQKWLEFLITIQAGLAVALGFLMRSSETPATGQIVQSPKVPHAALYLIAGLGILFSTGITWLVMRERKWTAWYVHRFNQLPGYKGKVFPSDQRVPNAVGSQPIGRFSQIAIALGALICLAWVAVILWAKFYH